MWLHLGASAIGTSHVASGAECQDHCAVRLRGRGKRTALIFAVSDGAGSAERAAQASKLSAERLVSEIYAMRTPPREVTAGHVEAIYELIRDELVREAEKAGLPKRELSATLLGGCVTQDFGWFCQVGDGAIVASQVNSYSPITWPSSGEFVNSTTFLVSDGWRDDLQFKTRGGPFDAVAAFSDGLQELILVASDQSVHRGFFDPLFAAIRKTPNASLLSEPLRAFLGSPQINARTDDDKTLVLACWHQDKHADVPDTSRT